MEEPVSIISRTHGSSELKMEYWSRELKHELKACVIDIRVF